MIYKVFSSTTIEGLEQLVTSNIQSGWELAGGLAVVPATAFSIGALKNLRDDVVLNLEEFDYKLLFLQAMIKDRE